MSAKTAWIAGFVLLISAVSVFAAADPLYNFNVIQPERILNVTLGGEVTTKIYLYNYGNVNSHVTVKKTTLPMEWNVTFDPAEHETPIKVSGGGTVNITENVQVEPVSILRAKGNFTEGVEYVSVGSGYVPTRPVTVRIKVPETERAGKEFTVTVKTEAAWYDDDGLVNGQTYKELDFVVKVTEKKTTEKPVGGELEPQTITGYIVANASWIGVVGFLLFVIAYLVFFRKPKEEGPAGRDFKYSFRPG